MCDPPEAAFNKRDLREVYDHISEGGSYVGRCTAPLLVDKQNAAGTPDMLNAKKVGKLNDTASGVNNNSWEILKMLNEMDLQESEENEIDLYPQPLRAVGESFPSTRLQYFTSCLR